MTSLIPIPRVMHLKCKNESKEKIVFYKWKIKDLEMKSNGGGNECNMDLNWKTNIEFDRQKSWRVLRENISNDGVYV